MQFIEETSDQYSVYDYYISEQFGRGIYPRNERKFRKLMKEENDGSLEKFNEKYGTSVLSWDEVRVEERDILSRNFTGDYQGFSANESKDLCIYNFKDTILYFSA